MQSLPALALLPRILAVAEGCCMDMLPMVGACAELRQALQPLEVADMVAPEVPAAVVRGLTLPPREVCDPCMVVEG